MEFNEKDAQLDNEKLKKLEWRVFSLERENYATRKFKDNEIVERIIRMITAEVENDN